MATFGKKLPPPFPRKDERIDSRTGGEAITYLDSEETPVLESLKKRKDFDALRFLRLINLPDLTRKENSPVKLVIDTIVSLPLFKDFDIASIPETITTEYNFDLFDFPSDHPARRPTDTYFITPERLLRTQTTSMWMYYLLDPNIVKKLETRGWLGVLSYGKVYRKDEIDRKHSPIFHQIDGLFLTRRSEKVITLDDLHGVLTNIVQSVFGPNIEARFLDDNFPYTHPSTQMEIKFKGEWLEILGAGLARETTLKNLNIDPQVYNGWAFGFGVERLAMQKMNIPDIRILWSDNPRITKQFTSVDSQYEEISKYPTVTRDISFIVNSDVVPNRFYEIVRELGKDLIEEVQLIDEYENEKKLGEGKKSYTFRIVYRSFARTLTNDEVSAVHHAIEHQTTEELRAVIR
ncbi:MAG: hypothetical protein AAB407_00290 [Patescibacteria group bacterium]